MNDLGPSGFPLKLGQALGRFHWNFKQVPRLPCKLMGLAGVPYHPRGPWNHLLAIRPKPKTLWPWAIHNGPSWTVALLSLLRMQNTIGKFSGPFTIISMTILVLYCVFSILILQSLLLQLRFQRKHVFFRRTSWLRSSIAGRPHRRRKRRWRRRWGCKKSANMMGLNRCGVVDIPGITALLSRASYTGWWFGTFGLFSH